jgi:hypothetical protein
MKHPAVAPLVAPLLGLAAALTFGSVLGGFGDSGHRIVGRVAEFHLQGSKALTQVSKILRPGESLADASVWPDTIKDPLYEDGDTPLFRLEHPAQDTYHYTNIPFQATGYNPALPGARPTDLLQITRECIRVLRGSSTVFTPREALRMLAHLVGDVHQPVHSGNAYVSASGPLRFVMPNGPSGWRSSAGGNALVYGPQDRFNLHSYWDTHVVNLAMQKDDVASYAARLVKELPVAPDWQDAGDADAWPERWVNEALVHARDAYKDIGVVTYLGPDEAGRTPHRWRIQQPPGYDERSRARIRIQLAKGGYRLAALLRAIWDGR